MPARVALGIAVLLLAAGPLAAGERYFLTLFGAQASPPRTPLTHTFAVFTRTAPQPDGTVTLDSHTVSWMPATLRIRPYALRPESGQNLTLDETFAWIGSFAGTVSVWGPFEITAGHFAGVLERKALLDNGTFAYRAIGGFTRTATISNCGQSFTRPAPDLGRRLQPTPAPGESGTSKLAARYVRAGDLIDPDTRHDWLLPHLGITYPLTPREPGERVGRFVR